MFFFICLQMKIVPFCWICVSNSPEIGWSRYQSASTLPLGDITAITTQTFVLIGVYPPVSYDVIGSTSIHIHAPCNSIVGILHGIPQFDSWCHIPISYVPLFNSPTKHLSTVFPPLRCCWYTATVRVAGSGFGWGTRRGVGRGRCESIVFEYLFWQLGLWLSLIHTSYTAYIRIYRSKFKQCRVTICHNYHSCSIHAGELILFTSFHRNWGPQQNLGTSWEDLSIFARCHCRDQLRLKRSRNCWDALRQLHVSPIKLAIEEVWVEGFRSMSPCHWFRVLFTAFTILVKEADNDLLLLQASNKRNQELELERQVCSLNGDRFDVDLMRAEKLFDLNMFGVYAIYVSFFGHLFMLFESYK